MNPLQLVTALGAERLYLLTILTLIGSPILQKRLESITGWSKATVAKHLDGLAELQLARRDGHRGGWMATTEARQLRLGETLEGLTVAPSDKEQADDLTVLPAGHRSLSTESEQLSTGQGAKVESLHLKGLTVSPSRHLDSSELVNKTLNTEKTHSLELEAEPPTVAPSLYDPRAVLDEYGIDGKQLDRLSARSDVTAEYIDAHIVHAAAYAKRQHMPEADAGLRVAVKRMLNQWTPDRIKPEHHQYLSPNGLIRQHERDRRADEQARRRYLD